MGVSDVSAVDRSRQRIVLFILAEVGGVALNRVLGYGVHDLRVSVGVSVLRQGGPGYCVGAVAVVGDGGYDVLLLRVVREQVYLGRILFRS